MARIAGVDIPNGKRIEIALTYIYGIGRSTANQILAKTGIDPDTRAQALTEEQIAKLREEIEAVECKSANVDRFLSIVDRYTEIPELTPHILHEFVEKIVIYAATDPHSKVNRRQQVDIYYKGIGILEISKVFDTRHK